MMAHAASSSLRERRSRLRPVGDVLADYLPELHGAPSDVDELRRRLRSRVAQPRLWDLGTGSEQLALDLEGAA